MVKLNVKIMAKIEDITKSFESGTAMYARYRVGGEEMETGFFVREDKSRIDSIPDTPNVYFKAVMFELQGVVLVAVLLKIEGMGSPYDTWWDFQREGVRNYIEDIISQSHLVVHLYSDQKREKSIRVRNSLKEPFEKFFQISLQKKTWTEDQFVLMHKKISQKYQNVQKLWDVLSKPGAKQRYSDN